MYTIRDLYDLDHTLAKDYLLQFNYPWEALDGIKNMILELGPTLDPEEYEEVSEHVWVHKTASVFPSAYLGAPCIIGPRKSDTARLSAAAHWSVLTVSSAIPAN